MHALTCTLWCIRTHIKVLEMSAKNIGKREETLADYWKTLKLINLLFCFLVCVVVPCLSTCSRRMLFCWFEGLLKTLPVNSTTHVPAHVTCVLIA